MNRLSIVIAAIILIFTSCSVTRTVPKGKYIVNKVKIDVKGNKPVSVAKLKRYVQQPQLKRLFGLPVYAYLYNIPDPRKTPQRIDKKREKLYKKNQRIARRYDYKTAVLQAKRNRYWNLYLKYKNIDTAKARTYLQLFKQYDEKVKERKRRRPGELLKLQKRDVFTWWEFLQKIGQPPPIYDTNLINRSILYMKNYLMGLGYYHPVITVITRKKGQKVDIKFVINPGQPLIIDTVEYVSQDSTILQYINSNKKLKLRRGIPLAVKYLQQYRRNFAAYMKEHGYYYFSEDYISFDVDTTGRGNKAKVYVKISQAVDRNGNPIPHRKFYINNVYIFSDYNPNEALANPKQYFAGCDTAIFYKDDTIPYYFIRKNRYIIKPKHILREVYIKPNSLFRFSSVQNTYLHLSKFAIYKLVDIEFKEVKDTVTNNELDCTIKLTPGKSQSISTEIVGTNSSATIGGAVNFTYKHKNLFRGGEIFTLKFHTALESQKFYVGTNFLDSLFNFNTQEYSVESQIMFPRLLLPFRPGEFIEKNNPRTVVQFFYSFQDRPEYNRVDLTYTWSYFWKANDFTNHVLTLSRISSVRIWDMIPEFVQLLQQSYLLQSYENYFIFGTSYSFTFSNQIRNNVNPVFFRFNYSSSGNMLYMLMKLLKAPLHDGSYYMPGFKTTFAQFVKVSSDLRVYHNFLNNTQLAWRLFVGVGVPYLNSKVLPFGERFFIGGSNSIRAWQARTLGPGSYKLPANIKYPNQTADMRLETNLEYRYPLVWKLEGAVFLDVGNIWAVNKYDNRPGALFEWNKFYKQLAIGTGTGLRLNLKFLVLRLDLGIKVYDPSAPAGSRFILLSRPYRPDDFVLNLGIGYPF